MDTLLFLCLKLNILKGCCQGLEAFFQYSPRLCNIDALEAAAVWPEDMTAVQPEVGLVNNNIIQLLVAKVIGSEIQPDKIGALGLYQMYLGEIGLDNFFGLLEVAFLIGSKLIEPCLSFFVGSLAGK